MSLFIFFSSEFLYEILGELRDSSHRNVLIWNVPYGLWSCEKFVD